MATLHDFDYYFKQAQTPQTPSESSNTGIFILVGMFIIFTLLFVLLMLSSTPEGNKDYLKAVNNPNQRIQITNNA